VQAQIINLINRIRRDMHLTVLFISYDLSVIRQVADRAAVMYGGRLMEIAPTEALFANPLHPYTDLLIKSAPVIRIGQGSDFSRWEYHHDPARNEVVYETGCSFRAKCRDAMPVCEQLIPGLLEVQPEHFVACHRLPVPTGTLQNKGSLS
jgi:oligopeptide/dipeptide ABC transporter ATP-binding protein